MFREAAVPAISVSETSIILVSGKSSFFWFAVRRAPAKRPAIITKRRARFFTADGPVRKSKAKFTFCFFVMRNPPFEDGSKGGGKGRNDGIVQHFERTQRRSEEEDKQESTTKTSSRKSFLLLHTWWHFTISDRTVLVGRHLGSILLRVFHWELSVKIVLFLFFLVRCKIVSKDLFDKAWHDDFKRSLRLGTSRLPFLAVKLHVAEFSWKLRNIPNPSIFE